VKLKTEAYFKRLAEDAIAIVGVVEPPVPIEDVVASLCIPLRVVNLPTFFTAATIYEDGLPVMVVNQNRPELARRLAIAHMLGHVLLLLDDSDEAFPRSNPDHTAAEKLGRELLMPTGLVHEQAMMWFNDYRYLSRLFGVTEAQMLDRMRELLLIKNQGITWDF
jgi:Zn-dependent peptidase ImmA (M78 family)